MRGLIHVARLGYVGWVGSTCDMHEMGLEVGLDARRQKQTSLDDEC